jgi:RNA polymerase sigma-70 factor (ECF subfamily)
MGTVIRAILGPNHPDCDDALQVALIGLVQALPAFRAEAEPAGYAATIAVRAAIAARKRARKRETWHAQADDEAYEAVSSADAVEAGLRSELLRDLLIALPAEQGETLAMRVVLGWSLEEIAAHTRAPFNTVRSRLRLAKEAMKRRIEADPALREALGVVS